MRYYDLLPPDCPPENAVEIVEPITMYRLVKTTPPTVQDFKSYRTLRPNDNFSGKECKASGLSVYNRRASAENQCRKPMFKGYQICELRLNMGAGKLQRSGGSHHTWWPYEGYVVSTNTGEVKL